MRKFKKVTNGFNFVFEAEIDAKETAILKMPAVSANKRGINDIGWQTDGDVTLYGTLSEKANKENVLWQEIGEKEDINKTVSALKIVNNGGACRVVIRAILN